MVREVSLMPSSEYLLEAQQITKVFFSRNFRIPAVREVSLNLKAGETLAVVGESGSGKSTLARLLLRLIPPDQGTIFFRGIEITRLSPRQLRPLRRYMQIVFQNPYASLDPRQRIGDALREALRLHRLCSKKEEKERVRDLLEQVGLGPELAYHYPYELSGGQRQRVGIARALAVQPELIIADEPVSSLDVSVRAQILNLLKDLQEQFHLAYLFISHDLSIVRHISHRVFVMYQGKIVEEAPVATLFRNPLHPYTCSLISAIPEVKQLGKYRGNKTNPQWDLQPPEGVATSSSGCPYAHRCPLARPDCWEMTPQLVSAEPEHKVACPVVLSGP